MIQIVHYRKKCIGCYACVEVAPDRWRISRKDGKCTLVEGVAKKDIYVVNVGDHELEAQQKAAEMCPVNIIHVKEL